MFCLLNAVKILNINCLDKDLLHKQLFANFCRLEYFFNIKLNCKSHVNTQKQISGNVMDLCAIYYLVFVANTDNEFFFIGKYIVGR